MSLHQINSVNALKKVGGSCAGKHCPNEGKYPLTIIYLKKTGWFCDECKNELVESKLVAEQARS
jgi:hypothetical protein